MITILWLWLRSHVRQVLPIALITCAVLLGSLWLYRWHTSSITQAVMNERAQRSAQYEQAKSAAISDEQRRAQTIVNDTRNEYEQHYTELQTRYDRLLSDQRTGAVRLSVPVKIPATCAVGTGDASRVEPNTGGATATLRAGLSDDAVQFFASEARRADQQAIEHNRLVNIIEALRLGQPTVPE